MISLTGLIQVVIYLVVAGLVIWLLFFLLDYVAPPEPFNKVARVVLMILSVLVVIGILLTLVGGTPVLRP